MNKNNYVWNKREEFARLTGRETATTADDFDIGIAMAMFMTENKDCAEADKQAFMDALTSMINQGKTFDDFVSSYEKEFTREE